jgi:hypothetical protein
LATGSAGRIDSSAGEKRVALAGAEHALEIANRAADQRLAAASRAVAEAVCAVLLEAARRAAEAILRAADELDERRASLDALALQVTQMQRSGGAVRTAWPPEIRAALSPEMRGAPRLPSRFSTPAGDDQVRRWSEVAQALATEALQQEELGPLETQFSR